MVQTATAPAGIVDPISDVAVSPEASLLARNFLKMVLAISAGAPPDLVATMKGLLANVMMNDYSNWWNPAFPVKVADAQNIIDEAMKLNPSNPVRALVCHAQGLVHRANGKQELARKAFREAKVLNSGFARAHAQFGNQKSYLGRLDEVQAPLNTAISLGQSPSRGYFYWGKGRGFFQQAVQSNAQSDRSEAIDCLQRSVDTLPSVWYNRCYLAAVQDAAGDATAARRTMQDFLNDQRFGRSVLAQAVAALTNPTGDATMDALRQKVHDFLSQI
jgi:tetratricopeptide (TPR) repeat protein